MNFNPCGYVCDIAHKSYSTGCKFHKDSAQVDTIEWTDALPDAPELPFPSVFMNLDLEPDPWYEYPVGEQPDLLRPFLKKKTPAGINGSHYCGTPADFLQGDTKDDRVPTVRYGALGWPLCCEPPFALLGGYGAGGISRLAYSPPLTPGTECFFAPVLTLGVTYVFPTNVTFGSWVTWILDPAGGQFTIHMSKPPVGGAPGFVYVGTSCLSQTFLTEGYTIDLSYTAGPHNSVWLAFFADIHGPYPVTVRVTQP